MTDTATNGTKRTPPKATKREQSPDPRPLLESHLSKLRARIAEHEAILTELRDQEERTVRALDAAREMDARF